MHFHQGKWPQISTTGFDYVKLWRILTNVLLISFFVANGGHVVLLKCFQRLKTEKIGKRQKFIKLALMQQLCEGSYKDANLLSSLAKTIEYLSNELLTKKVIPTCTSLSGDRGWMCCRCSAWNSSCTMRFCDYSCNFMYPLHTAAIIGRRFKEMLIGRSISQSGNRGTERSLWRLPYRCCCNLNLFLEGVVFNTATMPCSLSTDNDGSQLCIPAAKSGARRNYR